MDNNTTNYVGVLQEKCSKFKIALPEYVQHQNDKTSFECSCSVGTWTTKSKGLSKKNAKQQAAKQMMSKLEDEHFFEWQESKSKSTPKNPTSMLYEYCGKEKKSKPLFADKPDEDDLFVIECSFNGYVGVGKGSTKTEAREKAADDVIKNFKIDEYHETLNKTAERVNSLKNSISQLNELCQVKQLEIGYHEIQRTTLDKVPVFVVSCIVGDLKTTSSENTSKKLAKLEAADLMLNMLNAISQSPSTSEASVQYDLDLTPNKKQRLD